ncbi:hypothetical protein ACTPOK_41710 [Streptomyces inhibens]|uniref:hypothetical protein n=1 Tax=Streptomyces inhibens TaxID=2293571 RepID=UPI00402A7AEC
MYIVTTSNIIDTNAVPFGATPKQLPGDCRILAADAGWVVSYCGGGGQVGGNVHGSTVRTWLRDIEVFAGPLPEFVPDQAPADPVHLFLSWLSDAVADGLRDPHAMTLSTVDEAGAPDARVLILKGVDGSG